MTLNVLYGCMLALSGFWAAAAQDPDCWIEGMRVQGFNVDNVALPSREDCLQSCKDSTNDCQWFTFDSSVNYCSHFTEKTSFSSCAPCVSGKVTCENSTTELVCSVAYKCFGSTDTQKPTDSETACLKLCKTDSLCTWYTFATDIKYCSLYKDCTLDTNMCDNCLSGQRDCPLQGNNNETDSKILVVGGRGSWLNVELLDLPSSLDGGPTSCQVPPEYPLFLEAGIIAVLDFRIIICGGLFGEDEYNDCFELNPSSNQWERLGSMKRNRAFAQAVVVPGFGLWVTGGYSDIDSNIHQNTEILDSRTGSWEFGPDLPTPRYGHCAVQLSGNRTFIAAGNTDSGQFDNSVYIYSWEDKRWSPVGELSVGREEPACGLYGDDLVVVAGGLGQGGSMSRVDLFDTTTMTWSVGPELPLALSGASLVNDGQDLILVGGGGNDKLYRFETSSWIELTSLTLAGTNNLFSSITTVPDLALNSCTP